MLKESVFAAAMTLTPWHGDTESEAERTERLMTIAQAIEEAVLIATCADNAPQLRQAPVVEDTTSDDDAAASKDAGPASGEASEGDRRGGASQLAKADEPPAGECKRLWNGDPRQLAFLLLGQAYFETRLARHVHAGNCRTNIGECDSGRAISLWQLQAGYHLKRRLWKRLSGTDLGSTQRAAVEASRALGRSHNFCGTLHGAIALYATGQSCKWEPARRRARFVRRLQARR